MISQNKIPVYGKRRDFMKIKTVYTFCIVAGIILSLFEAFAIGREYDFGLKVFELGSSAVMIYMLAAVCCILAFAAVMIINKKDFHKSAENSSFLLNFLSAAALIVLFVFFVFDAWSSSEPVIAVSYAKYIKILSSAAALAGVAYFAVIAARCGDTKNGRTLLSVFGIIFVLHFVFGIISMYFAPDISYNDPIWNIRNFASVAMMLYIVSEVRFWIERPLPKYNAAVACISAIVIPMSFTADLMLYRAGTFSLEGFIYSVFSLIFILYVSARVYLR